MLLNSDLAEQTRETIMYAWKHKNFEECRKSVFKDYSFIVMVTNLIAELRKESPSNENRKKEISGILECVEHTQVKEMQDSLINRMSAVHGIGEEQFTQDQQLIEQLFSELDKSFKHKKEDPVVQGNDGAGEPSGLPQSSFSLTDTPYNVKSSSHSK